MMLWQMSMNWLITDDDDDNDADDADDDDDDTDAEGRISWSRAAN